MDTTLATSVQVIDRLLKHCGFDPAAAYARHGLDATLLAEPTARLPEDALDAVLAEAAASIPDPAFGLQAAHCWHPSHFGALGLAWLASSTLRRGLERAQRYWQLLGQRTALTLREECAGLAVVLDNPRRDPRVAAITTDIDFAVLLDLCRYNADRAFRPVEVRLMRPQPADCTPYADFFACPVIFEAADRAMVLPRPQIEVPLATSNRPLVGVLEQVLDEELARLDRTDVIARCRALLAEDLASGEASATRAAGALAMSRRTLHRRLAEAGTTWQELVDATRREMAMRLIEDRRRPIGEITFELGFSQQSTFARAFRRWAGTSPSLYREALPAMRRAASSEPRSA